MKFLVFCKHTSIVGGLVIVILLGSFCEILGILFVRQEYSG